MPSANEPDPPNASTGLLHSKGWQVAMIGLGTATAQLDTSVNIAFPSITRGFDLTIGDSAVIGSYARIYSHSHDPANYDHVTLLPTNVGAGARVGSHTIVLAGQHVGDGEMVGAFPTDRI